MASDVTIQCIGRCDDCGKRAPLFAVTVPFGEPHPLLEKWRCKECAEAALKAGSDGK